MSNEAKGPYYAGHDAVWIQHPDGTKVMVQDMECPPSAQTQAARFNVVWEYSKAVALTSQAARVKELEEALRLVREEARAWREEWRLYNMRGGGFMRPFIYEMNTDANDCLNTPALTPKEPQQ